MSASVRTCCALAAGAMTMLVAGGGAAAQKLAPQDLAAKLTGSWVLNRDLSPGFRAQAPGRRGGGGPAPRLLFASPAVGQRRGGGGGSGGGGGAPTDASDLTPEQRAQQASMRQLEEIDERLTIRASAESVTFVDARGERTFAINDKTSQIDVGNSPVKVKSKWDKNVLRQEFSNPQAKLVRTWGLDDADHLLLTAKIESLTLGVGGSADRVTTLVTPERKAVFERR
jgi:hypothetical protein